jgi:hypothetical protein
LLCRRRLHSAIDTVKFAVPLPPRAKLKTKPRKQGSLIRGDDKPGTIANVMMKLAAKINMTVVEAVGAGYFGAILWVKQRDVNRAARALGA